MKQILISFAIVILVTPVAGLAMEEALDGFVPPPSQDPIQRSPLIEALHQARADGDMALYYALQAQISVPTQTGENSTAAAIRRVSGTTIGIGEYDNKSATQKGISFDTDIDVRSLVHDRREFNQDMISDSNGNFYVVMEDTADDVNHFAQVYMSSDGGTTWTAFYFIINATASVETPTIAVGQGTTGDLLLLAYVLDDHTNPRYPEVATMALSGGTGFTVHPVTAIGTWDYYKPVIWTDSHSFSTWYAYMTAEAVYDAATNNVNVSFWQSNDGITWDTHYTAFGISDAFEWIDPDGSFGTDGDTVFLTCYNNTDNNLYAMTSDDFGTTFNTEIAVGLMDPEPSHAVDPDIEAAINGNNVMLVFTKGSATGDNPGQTYSTDAGATWTRPLWLMDGYDNDVDEFSVQLTANEGGGSWHATWTRADWWVKATNRPQDLSRLWPSIHPRVNDTDWASATYAKKGIASNWATDRAGVSWADYRGTGYDTFFAGTANSIFADGFESDDTSEWDSTSP